MGSAFSSFAETLAADWPVEATNLAVLRSTPSTNALARRLVKDALAESSAPEGVLLCAFEQTAGRGRRGNSWSSPPGGGIYATRITAVSPGLELAALPLAVGVALAEGLNEILPADRPCRLKWPNDLLVGGAKLGGVLIETAGDEPMFVLIGFGINVSGAGAELPAGATSLAGETASTPGLSAVLKALSSRLDERLAELREGRIPLAEYAALSLHRPGDRVQFRAGDERVSGTFLRFGPHGCLWLEVEGVERAFAAGEVIES